MTDRTAMVIRRLRAERELTQAEFGKLVGSHQATISKWEKGEDPRVYAVARVAGAFDLDFNALVLEMWPVKR